MNNIILKIRSFKVLLDGIFSLSILQLIILATPIFLVPYLINVIGLYNYGLIAYSAAIVNLINIITDYGFNLSATARVSESNHRKCYVTDIFSSIIVIKMLLLIISLTITISIINLTNVSIQQKLVIYANFGVCLAQLFIPTWLFHGLQRMRPLLFINVSYRIIMVLGILFYITEPADYWIIPIIYSASYLFGGLISLLYLRIKIGVQLGKVNIRALWIFFKESSVFFLSKLATSTYTSLVTILLGWLTTLESVGVYSAAEKVLQAAKATLSPISQATYPYITRLTRSQKTQSISFVKYFLVVVLFLTTCMTLGLYFLADTLVGLLFGNAHDTDKADIANIIKILSIVPLLVGVSNVLGVHLLVPRGFQKDFVTILSTAAVIGTVNCYYLIGTYNVFGAATSVALTEFMISSLMIYVVIKKKLLT